MTVRDMKDRLLDGEIVSYSWLPTTHMWADLLTKEMKMPDGLEDVLMEGKVDLPDDEVNLVKSVDGEIRMLNIRNRDKKLIE